jgi:hypothetical protein
MWIAKIALVALLLVAVVALADYVPTHYVTADADGTGDGSEGDPWTLAQAMVNAVAGNVVQVAPGVYTGTASTQSSNDWVATFAAYNAGTSSAPIIFYAQYPASEYYDEEDFETLRSELRNGGSYSGQLQAVLGTRGFAQSRRYVTYDGFYINGAAGYAPSPPSRGSVLLSTVGEITLTRLAIDLYHYSGSDNYVGIFIQPNGEVSQNQIRIHNNLFVGGANASVNHNGSVITTYYAQDVLIENNEFRNNNNGVFVKGGGSIGNAGTIRYNRFISPRIGGVEISNVHLSLELNVYQNIITDPGEHGIAFDNSDSTLRNANVYNNTIVGENPNSGLLAFDAPSSQSNTEVYNNLITALGSNSQVLVNAYSLSSYSGISQDHNFYYNNGSTPVFAFSSNANISGLSAWQTASGQDENGTVAAPGFVNAGGGDYKLATGSAALTAGATGGPVGAYITGNEVIGIDTVGGGDTDPPGVEARSILSSGATFRLDLDEEVQAVSDAAGLTLAASGGPVTLSACTTTSDLIDCTTSRQILGAETVTATYSGAGGIQDLASNALASFSGQAVTNSSSQTLVVISGLVPAMNTKFAKTTTQVSTEITTDKAATCRFGGIPGITWGSLNQYDTTGTTAHSETLSVVAGGVYQVCSRCLDTAAQQYSADACTSFSVDAQPKSWWR